MMTITRFVARMVMNIQCVVSLGGQSRLLELMVLLPLWFSHFKRRSLSQTGRCWSSDCRFMFPSDQAKCDTQIRRCRCFSLEFEKKSLVHEWRLSSVLSVYTQLLGWLRLLNIAPAGCAVLRPRDAFTIDSNSRAEHVVFGVYISKILNFQISTIRKPR